MARRTAFQIAAGICIAALISASAMSCGGTPVTKPQLEPATRSVGVDAGAASESASGESSAGESGGGGSAGAEMVEPPDAAGAAGSETAGSTGLTSTGGASGAAGATGGTSASAGSPGASSRAGAGAGGSAGKPSTTPAPACKIGQFKCVDDAIYKCNDAQTEFIKDANVKAPCGAGLCNEKLGKCNACVAGSKTCSDKGDAVVSCSDDGQTTTPRACESTAPVCTNGACGECRMDSDPNRTGCAAGNDCKRMADKLVCQPVGGTEPGMKIKFCHSGACKVTLSPGYELDLKADWRTCLGAPEQAPLGAPTVGVMLWPTAMTDLVIPLADSGWFCKLPAANGNANGCIVNSSQSVRDLYIWGPIETGCNYAWVRMADGIDAAFGAGCETCKFEEHPNDTSADFAFNMGFDDACRCPKVHFAAVPAKK